MQDFKNKVAVITGAASGIGQALAEKCVHEQMRVVLADINESALQQLTQKFKKQSADVIAVVTDVAREADIQNLAHAAVAAFDEVHLLFNNAGISGVLGAIWEVPAQDLERVLNTNLMSVIYGLRTFVPIMLAQGNDCHIINTASGAGLHALVNSSGYCASKYAVVALSEVLYYDLKQRQSNIHVSVLCPGSVKTKIADHLSDNTGKRELDPVVAFLKRSIADGLEPAIVADKTFAAIRARQLYVLTHAEHKAMLNLRIENILSGTNPSLLF